jgi:hypothetical protein
MDQDPEAIKRDIEQTRERMGDTVEALSYKTDVPARAKDAVSDRVDAIKGAVSDVGDSARTALGGAASSAQATAATAAEAVAGARCSASDAIEHARNQLPSERRRKNGSATIRSFVARNPLGLALGSVAAGFLVGLTLPVSDLERDQVGPIGEYMVDSAKAAAGNVVEQGKAAVTQAVGDALNAKRSL